MIEVRATQAGDHAGGVQLEGLLVGLDRDGHLVEVEVEVDMCGSGAGVISGEW